MAGVEKWHGGQPHSTMTGVHPRLLRFASRRFLGGVPRPYNNDESWVNHRTTGLQKLALSCGVDGAGKPFR